MSEFLDFVKWLNDSKIQYIIPWGYETLPTPSGGDVDLCVSFGDYATVAEELKQRNYTATSCPKATEYETALFKATSDLLNMRRSPLDDPHLPIKHYHEYFTQPNRYTIDMFTTFCFAHGGKTTVLNIDPKYFLATRVWERDYWIATPAVETLFTCLRIIGGREDCVKRLDKYLEKES